MIPLFGDTYPIRIYLQGLGGRWDNIRKCWCIPEAKIDLARAELARMTAKKRVSTKFNNRHKSTELFAPRGDK